jgi:hypothetical protein
VTARARAGASRRCDCGLCGTAAGTSRESGGLPGGRPAPRRGAARGGAARRAGGRGRPAQLAGGRDGNAEERKRDKTARGPWRRARQPGSGPKHGGRASPSASKHGGGRHGDVRWPVGRRELGWPRNRATVPDRSTTNPSRPWGARGRERARARACVCSIGLCFIRVRRYGRGVQRQDNIFLAGRY